MTNKQTYLITNFILHLGRILGRKLGRNLGRILNNNVSSEKN